MNILFNRVVRWVCEWVVICCFMKVDFLSFLLFVLKLGLLVICLFFKIKLGLFLFVYIFRFFYLWVFMVMFGLYLCGIGIVKVIVIYFFKNY